MHENTTLTAFMPTCKMRAEPHADDKAGFGGGYKKRCGKVDEKAPPPHADGPTNCECYPSPEAPGTTFSVGSRRFELVRVLPV